MLTVDQLARISENPDPKGFDLAGNVEALVPRMREGKITTRPRVRAFLATAVQETDRLKTLEEYGDESYYRSFLGDQWRYHGRGYIMNTWLAAYRRLSGVLGVDLVKNPDLLAKNKDLAARAAVWFWTTNGINRYADEGNFWAVSGIVNTGSPNPAHINGWEDRKYFYDRAGAVLPKDFDLDADAGKPKPPKEEPVPDKPTEAEKLKRDVEDAIAFGMNMIGAPYGTGWAAGTWPALSPLYSKISRRDKASWYRERECICSGFINVLRFEVCGLPAVGRAQGDDWPGGTAAIGRHLAFAGGSREYPPIKNTPRGWLVWSPYLGSALPMQGHVGIALGNGKVLEARVPTLSANRTENEGSNALVRGGARPYTRIIPPELWMRK